MTDSPTSKNSFRGANAIPRSMSPKKKHRRIQFLIERRYSIPSAEYLAKTTADVRARFQYTDLILARNDYYIELENVHESILIEAYANELADLRHEITTYCRQGDAAIMMHYAKMSTWTPIDSLSLWIGSIPHEEGDIINWALRNRRVTKSALDVLRRWKSLQMSLKSGALNHNHTPRDFALWARSTGFRYPKIFNELISGCLGYRDHSPSTAASMETIRGLQLENEILKRKLADNEDIDYKKYVKLFAAVCVGIYGYDPYKKKNTATKAIKYATEIFIIKSEKTMLGWIRDALEELPDIEKIRLKDLFEKLEKEEGNFRPCKEKFR